MIVFFVYGVDDCLYYWLRWWCSCRRCFIGSLSVCIVVAVNNDAIASSAYSAAVVVLRNIIVLTVSNYRVVSDCLCLSCVHQECCYTPYGALIGTEDGRGGQTFFYHPRYRRLHEKYDVLPKQWCCLFTDNCERFYHVRPIDYCWGYTPLFIGQWPGLYNVWRSWNGQLCELHAQLRLIHDAQWQFIDVKYRS